MKENGKEFIRGYFYSAKKSNPNSLPSKEKKENSREVCTVNNQIESQDNDNTSFLPGSEGNNFKLTSIIKISLLLIFFSILILDLIYYFRHIGDENLIQKYQCEKEYFENECDKITIHDGPIIKNFCQEKEICMNIKYENVYFHSVIIKYFTEIGHSLIPTSLYSKIISTLALIVGLYVIKRI